MCFKYSSVSLCFCLKYSKLQMIYLRSAIAVDLCHNRLDILSLEFTTFFWYFVRVTARQLEQHTFLKNNSTVLRCVCVCLLLCELSHLFLFFIIPKITFFPFSFGRRFILYSIQFHLEQKILSLSWFDKPFLVSLPPRSCTCFFFQRKSRKSRLFYLI